METKEGGGKRRKRKEGGPGHDVYKREQGKVNENERDETQGERQGKRLEGLHGKRNTTLQLDRGAIWWKREKKRQKRKRPELWPSC